MIPFDIQVSNSKIKVTCQRAIMFSHVGGGGIFVIQTSLFQSAKSCRINLRVQARIQRGGGPGVRTPPPWDLSEAGSCVETLLVGEGVQRLFYLNIIFFSGSLRSPVLYKHITCNHTSKFNLQYGAVILSLYFPYQIYENYPTSHPLAAFLKDIFIFVSCL